MRKFWCFRKQNVQIFCPLNMPLFSRSTDNRVLYMAAALFSSISGDRARTWVPIAPGCSGVDSDGWRSKTSERYRLSACRSAVVPYVESCLPASWARRQRTFKPASRVPDVESSVPASWAGGQRSRRIVKPVPQQSGNDRDLDRASATRWATNTISQKWCTLCLKKLLGHLTACIFFVSATFVQKSIKVW